MLSFFHILFSNSQKNNIFTTLRHENEDFFQRKNVTLCHDLYPHNIVAHDGVPVLDANYLHRLAPATLHRKVVACGIQLSSNAALCVSLYIF